MCTVTVHSTVRWWSDVVVGALASTNKVNQRLSRLLLRWVTVSGFNSRCGTFIWVCDLSPSLTQPGHPFVGRRNEYQPKGGDVTPCGWRVKAGMVRVWVAGKTVWTLDTRGPYLSALEIRSLYITRYINLAVYLLTLQYNTEGSNYLPCYPSPHSSLLLRCLAPSPSMASASLHDLKLSRMY